MQLIFYENFLCTGSGRGEREDLEIGPALGEFSLVGREGRGSAWAGRSVSSSGSVTQPGKSRGDFWGGMGSPEQVLKDKVKLAM